MILNLQFALKKYFTILITKFKGKYYIKFLPTGLQGINKKFLIENKIVKANEVLSQYTMLVVFPQNGVNTTTFIY
jgi:hypothetical protein